MTLWTVAGWHDENEHAGRRCEVLSYEKTHAGEMVRVRFVDEQDLFGDEAFVSPHMLLPILNKANE